MKSRIFLSGLAAAFGIVLFVPLLLGGKLSALETRLLDVAVAPAMAQQAHNLLIDRHTAAGVSCQACHGEAAFTEPVAMQLCTDCHGSYARLAAMTPWEPNPHQSHMGEVECSVCHNIHKASESFCDQCHSFGMQVP